MTNDTLIWDPRYAIWIALKQDGETQKDLAEKLGWDAGKLSRLISGETKKIDILVLQRIAQAQGRPLTFYTERPEPPILPDFVAPLTAPLGRRTVDYGTNPSQPWYERLIPDLPQPVTLKAA